MHQEIVKAAGGNADVRVYLVWMPMLPTDNQGAAEERARTLAGENVAHFHDPQRRAGIQFVEDHFDAYMKTALAAMPEDHQWREPLARQAAAPASDKPLWDAVLLFAPGAEWSETSPEPAWWTRQVGFSGEAKAGESTGQFWRKGAADVLPSDWFDEVREGLNRLPVTDAAETY